MCCGFGSSCEKVSGCEAQTATGSLRHYQLVITL